MTKPPTKTTGQATPIKRTVRFPPHLLDELTEAAERNAWSFNAEVLHRINTNSLELIQMELADIKAMVQRVIDKD